MTRACQEFTFLFVPVVSREILLSLLTGQCRTLDTFEICLGSKKLGRNAFVLIS